MNNVRPYVAEAGAVVKTSHDLFENTAVTVKKAGTFDIQKLTSGAQAMPSVKQVKSLLLIPKEKKTYLQAELLVFNPTTLPLYIDKARYFVKHNGQLIAQGDNDLEKILPANGTQKLQLELAVNNHQFGKLTTRSQGKKEEIGRAHV